MSSPNLENFNKIIFLCGFMAAGKTKLGKNLSFETKLPFLDLDEYIEEHEGMSVKEIFEQKGEAYFREKEWFYLQKITTSYIGILSLGGGALHTRQVVDFVKSKGVLVYVKTPFRKIVARVRRNTKRPIVLDENGEIKSKERLFNDLKTLYSGRKKIYKQAHFILKTKKYKNRIAMVNAVIENVKKYE